MDEPRLPRREQLGHLARLDVLVDVLGIVRREEPGELVARVVDEVGDRLQPGQDDQVAFVEFLPELVAGQGGVDEDRGHGWFLVSLVVPGPVALTAMTDLEQVNASA